MCRHGGRLGWREFTYLDSANNTLWLKKKKKALVLGSALPCVLLDDP